MAGAGHPNKEIAAAIEYALTRGWRFEKSGPRAHSFGKLMCPFADRDGCTMWIWSTPQSPQNHANKIRRYVEKCIHLDGSHE